jgi:hypothetical protein
MPYILLSTVCGVQFFTKMYNRAFTIFSKAGMPPPPTSRVDSMASQMGSMSLGPGQAPPPLQQQNMVNGYSAPQDPYSYQQSRAPPQPMAPNQQQYLPRTDYTNGPSVPGQGMPPPLQPGGPQQMPYPMPAQQGQVIVRKVGYLIFRHVLKQFSFRVHRAISLNGVVIFLWKKATHFYRCYLCFVDASWLWNNCVKSWLPYLFEIFNKNLTIVLVDL